MKSIVLHIVLSKVWSIPKLKAECDSDCPIKSYAGLKRNFLLDSGLTGWIAGIDLYLEKKPFSSYRGYKCSFGPTEYIEVSLSVRAIV